MVRGLATFHAWFKDFADQYVLIGGTAASIAMTEAAQPFRTTKDLDIVLHLEALTTAFGEQFWRFVQAGGYQQKEQTQGIKPCLYRFQKPSDHEFPHALELFARLPERLNFVPPGHLTPVPIEEGVPSLSAILLDDDYYHFVLSGRRASHGMPPWIGEDRLIPLKAIAWMEMNDRLRRGEKVDSKNISKHLADIVQLSALLQPGRTIQLPVKLRSDLHAFAEAVLALDRPRNTEAIRRIAAAFGLNLRPLATPPVKRVAAR